MDDDWFYMIRDEVRGPMTADQLRNAALKGLVQSDTNVRKGTNGDWVRAHKVKNLLPSGPAANPDVTRIPPPASPPKPSPVRIPKRSDARPTIAQTGPTSPTPPTVEQSATQSAALQVEDDEWEDVEDLPLIDEKRQTVSGPLKRRHSRRRSSPLPVFIVAIIGVGSLLGLLYLLSRL